MKKINTILLICVVLILIGIFFMLSRVFKVPYSPPAPDLATVKRQIDLQKELDRKQGKKPWYAPK